MECVTCKHHISVDESEVYRDDELDTLCPNIECPVCGSTQGYTAFGKIEKYEAPEEEEDEEELDFPEEPDEDALDSPEETDPPEELGDCEVDEDAEDWTSSIYSLPWPGWAHTATETKDIIKIIEINNDKCL